MGLWDVEKSLHRVVVIPEFVKLCGDLASGTLLSQIVYWFRPGKNGHRKLVIARAGRLWLAKNREEWADECGLTLKQVRRCMPLLEELGVIETERHLFAGKITPHIWLNEVKLWELLTGESAAKPETPSAEVVTIGPFGPNPLGHKGAITSGPKGSIASVPLGAINTVDFPSTTAETTTCAKAPDESNPDYGGKSSEGERMKASDVLAQKAQKGWPNTPGGNSLRWKSRMSTMYGYQKELTLKDRAMLKKLGEYAGDHTPDLIDYVTQHWMKFGGYVRDKMNLQGFPQVPSFEFLLKYVMLGLQLIADEENPSNPAHADESSPEKVKYVYED